MNRIKELREEFNIPQWKLAETIHKTQQAISLYENGTNEPDIDSYIMMSQIFNCSIEYIAGKSSLRNHNAVSIFDISDLSKKEINDVKRFIEFLKYKKRDV
jgi:DNA-binding XRE family transcriptional regulator